MDWFVQKALYEEQVERWEQVKAERDLRDGLQESFDRRG